MFGEEKNRMLSKTENKRRANRSKRRNSQKRARPPNMTFHQQDFDMTMRPMTAYQTKNSNCTRITDRNWNTLRQNRLQHTISEVSTSINVIHGRLGVVEYFLEMPTMFGKSLQLE